jgi:hypothetical protein
MFLQIGSCIIIDMMCIWSCWCCVNSILILNTWWWMISMLRCSCSYISCSSRWSNWWTWITFYITWWCTIFITKWTWWLMVWCTIVFLFNHNEKKMRNIFNQTYIRICRIRGYIVCIHARWSLKKNKYRNNGNLLINLTVLYLYAFPLGDPVCDGNRPVKLVLVFNVGGDEFRK